MSRSLLLISNGHGEDAIGATLAPRLQAEGFTLAALPIVGAGHAYRRLGLEIVGPTREMPSGGFIYGRPKALASDLAGGLVGLTLQQIAAVRHARDRFDLVLAIGDVVPLAFAWLARKPYAFVGCAKSDHYLGGKPGSYFWHERALLRHPRCRGAYPRDAVTTENLRERGIDATYLGNPMMDDLEPRGLQLPAGPGGPTVLVLPGSRGEAVANFNRLAEAAALLHARLSPAPRFLAAIAPGLPLEAFAPPGWAVDGEAVVHPAGARIHLLEGAFADAAHACDLALAMAGTASEQVAGLGKPIVSLSGEGPQFTDAFAEAQTRLLGAAVTLAPNAAAGADEAEKLLYDMPRRQAAAAAGRARMGEPGASVRIARAIAGL